MFIDVTLENWSPSPVIRVVRKGYTRLAAASYADAAARLTPRQGVFYRNLIRIAEVSGTAAVPVDFLLPCGEHLYLDRGCVKIAELAGFICSLRDDDDGVVSYVELSWTV